MISYKRPFLNLFILILIIFGWWHIALVGAIFGLLKFRSYIEIIFFGLIYDSLFHMTSGTGALKYIGTIIGISAYIIYFLIKGALRR